MQGTQLLAIDVAAAMGLLRRAIIGDELTEKERKFLRRTLTDLASVVPIGVLMLLPVSNFSLSRQESKKFANSQESKYLLSLLPWGGV